MSLEEVTKIYNDLKIYNNGALKPEDCYNLLETIKRCDLALLKAETGSGKTTAMPPFLAAMGARVFCAIPTRVAARGAYRRIKETQPTINVGYSFGGETMYDDSTQLIYCTYGHLKNVLLSFIEDGKVINKDKYAKLAGVIMIDEAHMGEIDADIIFGLWKYMVDRKVMGPRLLFASATIDSSMIMADVSKCTVFVKGTTPKPIEMFWNYKTYKVNDKDLYKDLASKIIEFHNEMKPPEEGSKWIVFLPGAAEIKTMRRLLLDIEDEVEIQTLESKTKKEDQDHIIESIKPNERMIILSTNVAETGLTVKFLDGVFDSMLERLMIADDKGKNILTLVYISRSSANQRKGRTGRQVPGFCYRMMTEEFYNKSSFIKENKLRAIDRESKTEAFLNLAGVGIKVDKIFTSLTVVEIDLYYGILERLGMVQNEKITEKGKFAAKVGNLSVRGLNFLWYWLKTYPNENYVYPGVVLISLIDNLNGDYFFKEKEDTRDTKEMPYYQQFKAPTYLEMYLNMWDGVTSECPFLQPKRDGIECIKNYTNKYSLRNDMLGRVYEAVSKVLIALFREMDINFRVGKFNIKKLLNFAGPVFELAYKDKIMNNVSKNLYKNKEDIYTLQGSALAPNAERPERLYSLAEMATSSGNKKGAKNTISLFYPVFTEKRRKVEGKKIRMKTEDLDI